jgi:hypothetical protein
LQNTHLDLEVLQQKFEFLLIHREDQPTKKAADSQKKCVSSCASPTTFEQCEYSAIFDDWIDDSWSCQQKKKLLGFSSDEFKVVAIKSNERSMRSNSIIHDCNWKAVVCEDNLNEDSAWRHCSRELSSNQRRNGRFNAMLKQCPERYQVVQLFTFRELPIFPCIACLQISAKEFSRISYVRSFDQHWPRSLFAGTKQVAPFPSESKEVKRLRESGMLSHLVNTLDFTSDDLAVIVLNLFLEVFSIVGTCPEPPLLCFN